MAFVPSFLGFPFVLPAKCHPPCSLVFAYCLFLRGRAHTDAPHPCLCSPSLPPSPLPPRRRIQDFSLVKEVGSGAASTVYYALCRKSCLPVAIKMYSKHKLTVLNRRQVGTSRRDGQTDRGMRHVGCCVSPAAATAARRERVPPPRVVPSKGCGAREPLCSSGWLLRLLL